MEERKGIPPGTLFLIVLIVCCALLIGIWYGGKYFNKEEENPETPEEVSSSIINQDESGSETGEQIKLEGEILNFPQNTIETQVALSALRVLSSEEIKKLIPNADDNFNNKEITKGKNKFTVFCKEYSTSEHECQKPIMSINGNLEIELKDYTGIVYSELYSYGNMYVLFERSTETVRMNVLIYDSERLLYELKLLNSVTDGVQTIKTEPVVKSLKLYFVSEENYDNERFIYDCKYQYIDISNSGIDINTIQSFKSLSKAYFNQR